MCKELVPHVSTIIRLELDEFIAKHTPAEYELEAYEGAPKGNGMFLMTVVLTLKGKGSEGKGSESTGSSSVTIGYLCSEYRGFYAKDLGVKGTSQYKSYASTPSPYMESIVEHISTFERLYSEDDGSGPDDWGDYGLTQKETKRRGKGKCRKQK